jgi:tRNA-Thr(GGU) m(6)t(6)A37 methyltransferase TsaA
MPIQSAAARGVPGRIELLPGLAEGTQDLDGFSHLWLIYHLHLVTGSGLTVTPFLDDRPHGVFATRSPKRPNPIGLSVVRLVRVEGSTLQLEDVDVLDGTPLLDIKPYVPDFDVREAERIGWFTGKTHRVSAVRSDDRFR